MLNKLTLVLILVAVFASGCAHKIVMQKTGVSESDYKRDYASCKAQALSVQSSDYAYRGTILEGAGIAGQQSEVFVNCMVARGYAQKE